MKSAYAKEVCSAIYLKDGIKVRLLLLLTTKKYEEATQSELLSVLKGASQATLSRNLNQLLNPKVKIIESKSFHGVCIYRISNLQYKTSLTDEESDFLIELCSAPLMGNATNIFKIAIALLDLDHGQGVTMNVLLEEHKMFQFQAVKEGLSKMINLQIVTVDKERRIFFLDKHWKYDYLEYILPL